MANTQGSLQSLPAGDSQVFDVGQQKDMLRATGNSPTEHLNCRELPGSPGKAGRRKWGSRRTARSRPSSQRLWQAQGQSTHAFVLSHQDLLITAAHPRVTAASLPLSLSHTHTNTVLLGHQRESSLFPNCNSLFLFPSRQYLGDLCPDPLLSNLEVRQAKSVSPGKELPEKPGAPSSETC